MSQLQLLCGEKTGNGGGGEVRGLEVCSVRCTMLLSERGWQTGDVMAGRT